MTHRTDRLDIGRHGEPGVVPFHALQPADEPQFDWLLELPVQKLTWAAYGHDGNRRNARHRYGPGKRGIPFEDSPNSQLSWPRLHTQCWFITGQDLEGIGTGKSNEHQDGNPNRQLRKISNTPRLGGNYSEPMQRRAEGTRLVKQSLWQCYAVQPYEESRTSSISSECTKTVHC